MQVKVNGQTIEIFAGAKVKDALMAYSSEQWKRVRNNQSTVHDGRGHLVGLDGELGGGEELFIKARAAAEPRS
jgi:hypothetical protein